MILDVDFLIDFFNKYSGKESKEEMGEQDAAAAPSSPSSGGGNIPKLSDSYKIQRGPGNMLGKKGEKWSTNLTRSVANQVW